MGDQVECPYCGHEFDLNHDDGAHYDQNKMEEEQCPECDKLFLVMGVIGLVVAAVAIWGMIALFGAVGSWWHSITYVSPEEQAAQDERWRKAREEWAKDPTNPDVIAQACIDRGGTPITSWWDGRVVRCDGASGDKNVKVEVSQ